MTESSHVGSESSQIGAKSSHVGSESSHVSSEAGALTSQVRISNFQRPENFNAIESNKQSETFQHDSGKKSTGFQN